MIFLDKSKIINQLILPVRRTTTAGGPAGMASNL